MGTPDEEAKKFRALQDELYRLRGQFLSDFNGVEAWIDFIIFIIFRPMERRQEMFRTRILANVPFEQKLDCVKDALGDHARQQDKDVLSNLRGLNVYRNSLAHSSLGIDLRTLSIDDPVVIDLVSHEFKRTGLRVDSPTTHELASRIESLGEAGAGVLDLISVGGPLANEWDDPGPPS